MSVSGTAGGRIAPGVGANLIGQHAHDRNQDATVYVGNLDPQVTEELVWELFTQAGPIVNVYLPKDRVTNSHQGYGFVEYRAEEDADYVSGGAAAHVLLRQRLHEFDMQARELSCACTCQHTLQHCAMPAH
eukprot:GHRQ01023060.1.p2 GENE.GHRQ01023060.1~~GHRQ01023060.1.p2  ORF type:complete len:131 (+),score=23.08 GHRQ01023060.1:820-1212(+)